MRVISSHKKVLLTVCMRNINMNRRWAWCWCCLVYFRECVQTQQAQNFSFAIITKSERRREVVTWIVLLKSLFYILWPTKFTAARIWCGRKIYSICCLLQVLNVKTKPLGSQPQFYIPLRIPSNVVILKDMNSSTWNMFRFYLYS